MEFTYNAIGILGSATIILAYLLLQLERLTSNSITYSILNLFGAAAIIFSLYFEPNLPSLVIESFWVLISIVGICRWLLRTNKQADQT